VKSITRSSASPVDAVHQQLDAQEHEHQHPLALGRREQSGEREARTAGGEDMNGKGAELKVLRHLPVPRTLDSAYRSVSAKISLGVKGARYKAWP
jgi:hypothetical protein